MIQTLNSLAKTAVAFPNCGCVISTTIAAMTLTNPRICVVNEIARRDGEDVQASRTIDAFPNGCSAMAKTIVVTTATSCQKTVPSANRKPTSSARTTDAFPSSGLVTLLMIAVMARMNRKPNVKANTANAQSPSSDATTANVSQADGDAVS